MLNKSLRSTTVFIVSTGLVLKSARQPNKRVPILGIVATGVSVTAHSCTALYFPAYRKEPSNNTTAVPSYRG
jgi:hypothetical protein